MLIFSKTLLNTQAGTFSLSSWLDMVHREYSFRLSDIFQLEHTNSQTQAYLKRFCALIKMSRVVKEILLTSKIG